jgi:hypothetical protein
VRTLQHCGAWEDSFTVGCTATPFRPHDAPIIDPVYQETVYHKHLLYMMLEGYLCDLVVKRLHVAGMDLKRVHTVAGDYSAEDLEAAMLKANAPAQIVSGIQQYAATRRLAVFSPGIAHAVATAAAQAREKLPARKPLIPPRRKQRGSLSGFRAGAPAACARPCNGTWRPFPSFAGRHCWR